MFETTAALVFAPQSDVKTNKYLLRRTSVQSFTRCSSEGGLPWNTQLHFDSAEATLGLGKHALARACRFRGSSQCSVLHLHVAHTHWQQCHSNSQPWPLQVWQESVFSPTFFSPFLFSLLWLLTSDKKGGTLTGLPGYPGWPGWPGWPGDPSCPGNPLGPMTPMWPMSPFFPSGPLGPVSPVTPFWSSNKRAQKSHTLKRETVKLICSYWLLNTFS